MIRTRPVTPYPHNHRHPGLDPGSMAPALRRMTDQVRQDENGNSSRLVLSLRRGGEFLQHRPFAQRPVEQVAAAIGADFVGLVGAARAERTFERADEGAVDVRGKITAAFFAIGSHFKHDQSLSVLKIKYLRCRGAHGIADHVDDLLDLPRVVTLHQK